MSSFFFFQKILSGSLQSLLASAKESLLVKAKSEVSLVCYTSQSLSCTVGNSGAAATVGATQAGNSPRIPEDTIPRCDRYGTISF